MKSYKVLHNYQLEANHNNLEGDVVQYSDDFEYLALLLSISFIELIADQSILPTGKRGKNGATAESAA